MYLPFGDVIVSSNPRLCPLIINLYFWSDGLETIYTLVIETLEKF